MRGVIFIKGTALAVVMFWNLENYFDPFDDPGVADEAFTPRGEYHWNWEKFCKKRDDIARTIIAAGDKYHFFPAVVGVAEVENRFVLNQLVKETPLARLGYKVIHKESPDKRGIDVGLLYRDKIFRPLAARAILVKISHDSVLLTRSVLYVKGLLNLSDEQTEEREVERVACDTLHLFVNHWPSKLGDKKISDRNRMAASNTVKRVVDSILNCSINAKILVMGDLNDSPYSEPVENLSNLINLAKPVLERDHYAGTNKYRESWNLIDQMLVSNSLFNEGFTDKSGNEVKKKLRMEIYSDNLLVEDKTFLGEKPFRTLTGPRYSGGVSDHLPIILIY